MQITGGNFMDKTYCKVKCLHCQNHEVDVAIGTRKVFNSVLLECIKSGKTTLVQQGEQEGESMLYICREDSMRKF
jgi:uncharacterized Fe-S radical SAM superfamily protein PflX